MESSKQLLFTFDYELFLGKKSGSVSNCLIIPTSKVLSLLDRYSIKGIFFVDTLYLYRLKEQSLNHNLAKKDWDDISKQLKNLKRNGHYVYPHIHPHWLDADYDSSSNMWRLENLSKYRFNSLSKDLKLTAFQYSDEILKDVLDDSTNMMDAYRAGGWSIQPFSDFKPAFENFNILADFTVMGKAERNTNASVYDFSAIETNQEPYKFSDKITEIDVNGKYFEFPINSLPMDIGSIKNRIIGKILWKMSYGRNFGDGEGVQFKEFSNTEKKMNQFEMISIELLTYGKLSNYLEYFRANKYMQFISHPKMISPHNLKMLSKFLKKAFKHGKIESDWKKMM